eukprot:1004328-Alexandrium_andersonii.AAC.1
MPARSAAACDGVGGRRSARRRRWRVRALLRLGRCPVELRANPGVGRADLAKRRVRRDPGTRRVRRPRDYVPAVLDAGEH